MTAGSTMLTSRPQTPVPSFRERSDSVTSSTVSVDDIVKWADRRRVSSAKQSRQSTLETVQSFMFRDPKRVTRPQTSKERRKTLKERPLTARSLCSEPPAPVTTPVVFSTLDGEDEDEGETTAQETKAMMSQQCCELLGPTVCHECAKKLRVQQEKLRYEHGFRSLRASEKNFTTTVLMKKNMPHLTIAQIQDRIAAGEVSQQQLRRLHEVRESPEEIEKRRLKREKEKQLLTQRKSKRNYSLREMNRRLAEGETGYRKKRFDRLSVTESLYPSFVSPRKVKYHEEPMFRVYYDPPLVAKHRQKSEPTFFAGSSFTYKLPDRLPDKIIFTKIKKEPEKVERQQRPDVPPLDPLDYEATYTDTVDNLIKEHLERS